MHNNLERYWQSIPVGRAHAAEYWQLRILWDMSERQVRKTLERLSGYDNGDNYILIRSSRNNGFYRTDDPADIEAYKREVRSRAMKIFAPFGKINRVLRAAAPEHLNYSFFNNIKVVRTERGLTQADVCRMIRAKHDIFVDASTLSKFENGCVLPTPAQLHALADILCCEPFNLIAIERDGLEIYAAEKGLQVPQS